MQERGILPAKSSPVIDKDYLKKKGLLWFADRLRAQRWSSVSADERCANLVAP